MDGADSSEPDRTMTERQMELHGFPQRHAESCAFLHISREVQYHLLQ